MFVLTIDQRRSRAGRDLVPEALALATAGAGTALGRPFERTVGDELQGVLTEAGRTVAVVLALAQRSQWHIGIGVGAVEEPLPSSTRAARGPAFQAARDAVEEARSSSRHIAVRAAGYVESQFAEDHARWAETGLWLVAHVMSARSDRGWEVVNLLAQGLNQREASAKLGVTQAAVSQRVSRAGWAEQTRGAELVVYHLAEAERLARLTGPPRVEQATR
jgi:predicted XRE-type DNA-binding protein